MQDYIDTPLDSGNAFSFPPSGFMCGSCIRYDVHFIEYSESESGRYFADLVDAKLCVILSTMESKGCPYRLNFMAVGSSLLILVTYQISSRQNTPAGPYPDTD